MTTKTERHITLKQGFTLIELLIVIVLLSTLAAMVVPHFTNTGQSSKTVGRDASARIVQAALDRYYVDHANYPGQTGSSTLQVCAGGSLVSIHGDAHVSQFANLLLMYSDSAGAVCDSSQGGKYRFGPYLKKLPTNPVCDNRSVYIVFGGGRADESYKFGWKYNPARGDFVASTACNTPG